LAVLGVGRLEHIGGGFHRFHLIDIPENTDAVDIAKTLLQGERPADMEQDKDARLLLSESDPALTRGAYRDRHGRWVRDAVDAAAT
jgi:hypothetical protein